MIPHGTPTNSFSARCARTANSGPVRPSSYRSLSARAVTTSSAADDERPAPVGTVDVRWMSAPGTVCPASRSAQTTPAGYAGQPVSVRGTRSSAPSATTPPGTSAECTRSTPSVRRETAATVVCGSASGITKPSLKSVYSPIRLTRPGAAHTPSGPEP